MRQTSYCSYLGHLKNLKSQCKANQRSAYFCVLMFLRVICWRSLSAMRKMIFLTWHLTLYTNFFCSEKEGRFCLICCRLKKCISVGMSRDGELLLKTSICGFSRRKEIEIPTPLKKILIDNKTNMLFLVWLENGSRNIYSYSCFYCFLIFVDLQFYRMINIYAFVTCFQGSHP